MSDQNISVLALLPKEPVIDDPNILHLSVSSCFYSNEQEIKVRVSCKLNKIIKDDKVEYESTMISDDVAIKIAQFCHNIISNFNEESITNPYIQEYMFISVDLTRGMPFALKSETCTFKFQWKGEHVSKFQSFDQFLFSKEIKIYN